MWTKQTPQSRNRFIPRLENLEERLCPADATGGMAFQVGPVLNVVLSNPVNMASLVDSGFGPVAVEWNTGELQTFGNVGAVQFISMGQLNSIFFALIGPVPAPHSVNFNLIGGQNIFFEQMKLPPGPNLILNVSPSATIFHL